MVLSACDEEVGELRRSAARIEETHRQTLTEWQRDFEARAGHESQRDADKALGQYRTALDGFLPALQPVFAKKRRAAARAAIAEEERKLDQAAANAKAAVLLAHLALDLAMVEARGEELRAFVQQTKDALALDIEFDAAGNLKGPSDDNELPLLRTLVKLCETRGELELDMVVPSAGNAQDERDMRRKAENIAGSLVPAENMTLKHFDADRLLRQQAIARAMPLADQEARKVLPSHERANARLAKLLEALGQEKHLRTGLVENDEERPMTLWVVVKTPCAVP